MLPTLHKQGRLLASAETQRAVLDAVPTRRTFAEALAASSLFPLRPTAIEVLQVNVGKRCNQTCRHCHVDAGPDRTEVMPRDVMERCLGLLGEAGIPAMDVTGGAPELHPDFCELITRARAMGVHVTDRCNLTVLLLPNYSDLPEFLAHNQVELVCSLPHLRARNTDAQRGDGVFEQSVEALHRLNALGYGDPGSGLLLNLVTNPVGAFLPGNQDSLERDWKRNLDRTHGIRFNRLYTITNMPISRFLDWLEGKGALSVYMDRLVSAFNPGAAAGVMCRTTLSVGWDGTMYDCDFNQMLERPVACAGSATVFDADLPALAARSIVVGPHCFGCTAGAGSSCGGATA